MYVYVYVSEVKNGYWLPWSWNLCVCRGLDSCPFKPNGKLFAEPSY